MDIPLLSDASNASNGRVLQPVNTDREENHSNLRLINATIGREVIRFMYPDPAVPEPVRQFGDSSPADLLLAHIPNRGSRPLSRRNDSEGIQSMFRSSDVASDLLDIEFLCRKAFETFGDAFPTSVWTCCQKVFFAALATGTCGSPRFFDLVKKIHDEANHARKAIQSSREFIQPSSRSRHGSRISSDIADSDLSVTVTCQAKEAFSRLAQRYLPVLLGQKDYGGISGRLCICSIKNILGVSLNFIYKRRTSDDGTSSLLDLSGSRQRALRRVGKRDGLTSFDDLPSFACGCDTGCLSESTTSHLAILYQKFAGYSASLKPYETENEFLIDLLYCPLTNADTSMCDRAIAEVLGVSARRVGRVRAVVLDLVSNPSLFVSEKRAPSHGMYRYASVRHPMNRVSDDLRLAISQGLDMVTRADPAGTDGSVTYRFYDPSVNSYQKIQKLLHTSMSREMGTDIDALSSSTFRRIFVDYLAERDGRLNMSRSDHNCCPYCQELELAVNSLEMELKVNCRDTSHDVRVVREAQLEQTKKALAEHVQWDRSVRSHLRELREVLRRLANDHVALTQRSESDHPLRSPRWNSKNRLALLTHQDEMTKANIPYFMRESLSTLTRYRYDVSAHVSAIDGSAVVFSHEQGTAQKNSGTVFEGILLDHLLTCRGEGIKVVWSDCASVGRSFFSCVACPQYMVDSGLCGLALFGFMANCHGKYLADSLFGQWKTRAKNSDMTSVDSMLKVFEAIRRSNGAEVRGVVLNPVSAINWQDNLSRLGYATSPPQDFRWEEMNPHYACACSPAFRESLPNELRNLLEPLMPRYDNCVRITSWPYFRNPNEDVPFHHRPIDVPAAALKPGTFRNAPLSTEVDEEWYLAVPRKQPFAATGDGVVAKATADVVGHNSLGFQAKVAMLKTRNAVTRESWPRDLELPPKCKDTVKVAAENWVARYTVMREGDREGLSRYPPLNLVNALDGRPPRERTQKHIFTRTYEEPPFPVIPGTCTHDAAIKLAEEYKDKPRQSVHILQLYRSVRLEMGIQSESLGNQFLQPSAQMASPAAIEAYKLFLRHNKERNKRRPTRKRSAYQLFRADEAEKDQMKIVLNAAKSRGEQGATLAKVSQAFWETASPEYKKRFEVKVLQEDERYEKEYAQFLEWQKRHDRERDAQASAPV